MPSPVFKVVKAERDSVAKDLANAQLYFDKATGELQNCQLNVDMLKKKLGIFDAWLLANPDI